MGLLDAELGRLPEAVLVIDDELTRTSFDECGGHVDVASLPGDLLDDIYRLVKEQEGVTEAITDIDNLRYAVYSQSDNHTEHRPMNVSLTPELEKFVSAKVESGRYNSASEVVREALRLLEEHDSARAAQLAEFNGELGRRLAALDRGEAVDPAAARARLQRKSEQRRKPRA